MVRNNIDLNMKEETIVAEKEGAVETVKGHGSLAEIEPYIAFLFHHWDKTARENHSFDGQAVQELVWRRWESAEMAKNLQRSRVEVSTRKRKRECESAALIVVADLLSEMLNSITEAEDVAAQMVEELLDRVCPQKRSIVYQHMAETVLGEVKVAELGLMEIRGE